jgi:alpha-L-rhamnosidase
MLKAKWIWRDQENYKTYNQTIISKKLINIENLKQASIKITADSQYRLFINEKWVNDGPCRSWPEHFQYDDFDITMYLKAGVNEIKIIARYWGVGTFHNVCQQAGLLAQIELTSQDGKSQIIGTDDSWQVAEAKSWIQNTPKVSCQMEPQEFYNAKLEESLQFEQAKVLFDTKDGPWKDLHARDVALLTKKPFSFKRIKEANVVRRKTDLNFCIPAALLSHPGTVEANHNTSMAGGMVTIFQLEEEAELNFHLEGMKISINGEIPGDNKMKLLPGQHLVLAFITNIFGHRKEKSLRIIDPPKSLMLFNPIDSNFENPWVWISFPKYKYRDNDIKWNQWGIDKNGTDIGDKYNRKIRQLMLEIGSVELLKSTLKNQMQNLPLREMFVKDTYWRFMTRDIIGTAKNLIDNPAGLIYGNSEITIVNSSDVGDIELVYDLGEQNCGYFDFEFIADEGVEIDIYEIEHITKDGILQHTRDNRNGMTYITRSGVNRFSSLKRRSGRFVYITFRNQKMPLQIRKFQLIESTYPVNEIGSFSCSDARLNNIWEISARTLKLCMEDTFTDCPLYEQTLWVGDARNEALFAFPIFGTTDIAKRCIRLAGQSLERFPITGCQVPSAWDCILPAWSFLWGISVWDYYWYSGDKEFLQEVWHWVVQNLKGAESLIGKHGLFSAPMWNMFDWSGIDDNHDTVLHCSMLIIGAIEAAAKCADVLDDVKNKKWLQEYNSKLIKSINKLWDDKKQAYRDSIHKNGKLSESTSQHTSFLSVLYNIIESKNYEAALKNMLTPPKEMVKVGSPFAILYFYEALLKVNREDEIIKSIYKSYLPMLEADATTVWETFASSDFSPGEFPTRSHCHAWSSAPLYFLNHIVLGIKQTAVGGKEFKISPRLNGLNWAKGTVATIKGPLHVSWKVTGKRLKVHVESPENVKVEFEKNDSHDSFEIDVKII